MMDSSGASAGDGEPLCRLCLAPASAGLLPLFPRRARQATARHARALRLVTGLAITLDDGLPQSICRGCAKLINAALELRAQCRQAQQILLQNGFQRAEKPHVEDEPMKEPCRVKCESRDIADDTNTLDSEYIDLDNYTGILESDDLVKENVKNELKSDENSSELYANNAFADSKSSVEVETKPKSPNNKDRVKRKYVKKADNATPIEKTPKINRLSKEQRQEQYLWLVEGPYDPRGPVKCRLCKKVLARVSNFILHTRTHFKGEFVCDKCGKAFHTKYSLSTHGMRLHGAERTLRCPHCDYRAVDRAQLKSHTASRHTGAREFVCDVCGAAFHCKPNVVQHMRRHFAAKNVQCDRCPAMFNSRSALASHTAKTHRHNFAYLCHACPRRYSGRCALRRHLARQHGLPRQQQGPVQVVKWRKGEPPPAHLAQRQHLTHLLPG